MNCQKNFKMDSLKMHFRFFFCQIEGGEAEAGLTFVTPFFEDSPKESYFVFYFKASQNEIRRQLSDLFAARSSRTFNSYCLLSTTSFICLM